MASNPELPDWPSGTVVILVTGGPRPHAIPVSAAVRAGGDRILIGLAHSRESLRRLREQPAVTVSITTAGVALSADGRARVIAERLTDRVAAVEVVVTELHDHRRDSFELQDGVRWRWVDERAAGADAEVQEALRRLAER